MWGPREAARGKSERHFRQLAPAPDKSGQLARVGAGLADRPAGPPLFLVQFAFLGGGGGVGGFSGSQHNGKSGRPDSEAISSSFTIAAKSNRILIPGTLPGPIGIIDKIF